MKKLVVFGLLLCLLFISSCDVQFSSIGVNEDVIDAVDVKEAMSNPNNWELIFSDEFDYEGLPDSSKWDYEEGYVRNNELQFYTKDRLENSRVENGNLIIETLYEEGYNELYPGGFGGSNETVVFNYTSASLITKNKAHFIYGKFEMRAMLPSGGDAIWPAFWLIGKDVMVPRYSGIVGFNEYGGEVDIMEHFGFDPYAIDYNVFALDLDGNIHQAGGETDLDLLPSESWHVYSLEWYLDRFEFFIDGESVFEYYKEDHPDVFWPFDYEHYIILNTAVRNGPDIEESNFPSQFLIDYIRVYGARPQCSDGIDNDGDGFVDWKGDSTCKGNPNILFEFYPECNDGIDNDGDGQIDYYRDYACDRNINRNSEFYDCEDGVDNDGDGLIDYPEDIGCGYFTSLNENPECNDGIDNDNDTFIDYPDDTDCDDYSKDSESNPSHADCRDGVDNDGDGLIDYPEDIGCNSPLDNDELPIGGEFWTGHIGETYVGYGLNMEILDIWYNRALVHVLEHGDRYVPEGQSINIFDTYIFLDNVIAGVPDPEDSIATFLIGLNSIDDY